MVDSHSRADSPARDVPSSTTHGELITYGIERGLSWRQSLPLRLEPGIAAPRICPISAPKTRPRGIRTQTQGVTYVPGLICHPCSRPHGEVRRLVASHSRREN